MFNILLVSKTRKACSLMEKIVRSSEVPARRFYHAENKNEAVCFIRYSGIDIVLADISISCFKRLIKECLARKIFIAALTGRYDDPGYIAELKIQGITCCDRKQFTPPKVKQMLCHIIANKSAKHLL